LLKQFHALANCWPKLGRFIEFVRLFRPSIINFQPVGDHPMIPRRELPGNRCRWILIGVASYRLIDVICEFELHLSGSPNADDVVTKTAHSRAIWR